MAHRLILAIVLAAAPAFPVAKEILQLQRDIAQLQEQVRSLQRGFDAELAKTQQLLNQNLEAAGRLSTGLVLLEKTVLGQEKVLVAPVANVSVRVDTLAGQFQALRDTVEELNSRLAKLQQQAVDIKNIVSAIPPPAPAPTASVPSQPATPPVSAETLWRNNMRDFQAGNYNLAGPGFADYIKMFPSTDQAAEAQYYLGEIFLQQGQFAEAVAAYDVVLERYPENRRTPDAQFRKGLSLLKQGKRDMAAREFRELVRKFPRSPAAGQATEALKGLGQPAPSARPATKTAKRR